MFLNSALEETRTWWSKTNIQLLVQMSARRQSFTVPPHIHCIFIIVIMVSREEAWNECRERNIESIVWRGEKLMGEEEVWVKVNPAQAGACCPMRTKVPAGIVWERVKATNSSTWPIYFFAKAAGLTFLLLWTAEFHWISIYFWLLNSQMEMSPKKTLLYSDDSGSHIPVCDCHLSLIIVIIVTMA